MNQKIVEKIQQRRLQILVHSYIYYELNQNIISDDKWNKWAHELVFLQEKYPEESNHAKYGAYLKGFDGSTGMDLKYDDYVKTRAKYLLKMKEEKPVKKQSGLLF